MKKTCDKAINEIIDQIIANEEHHKIKTGDADINLALSKLDVTFNLKVKEQQGKAVAFEVYCRPIVDLK